jgi:hypothetical protein
MFARTWHSGSEHASQGPAYNSDESGRHEVYVVPFPSTGERWQVSRAGGV